MSRAIPLIVGVFIGNFIYQALNDGNWSVAFERSYFQTAALLVAAFMWREA